MAQLPRKVEINLASIPVSGFGGMCMVVASLICAASLAETRWFMIAGILTGVVFGCAMILIRRMGDSAPPADAGHPPAAPKPGSVPARDGEGRSRQELTTLGRLRTAQI